MNLAVSTSGGKVELLGVAGSREQSDRAARLARSAPGVKVVDNQISIQPRS
jgi:osmotically-inducible protein OsmY